MGTNRRKAVKMRMKRLRAEQKEQAAKVAARLLGTTFQPKKTTLWEYKTKV